MLEKNNDQKKKIILKHLCSLSVSCEIGNFAPFYKISYNVKRRTDHDLKFYYIFICVNNDDRYVFVQLANCELAIKRQNLSIPWFFL